MIVRYSVSCGGGDCVGVPEPDGEYVVFVPEGVACDFVVREQTGMVVCMDKSGIRRYRAVRYNVYMYTGEGWLKVGRVNEWMTEVDVVYGLRPSIYVATGNSLYNIGEGTRNYFIERLAVNEECRRVGCVTDFYALYKPRGGGNLLSVIDWAITKKGWRIFGVV